METYSELLQEFHQQQSTTSLSLKYKSILDELAFRKNHKRNLVQTKTSEIQHFFIRKEANNPFSLANNNLIKVPFQAENLLMEQSHLETDLRNLKSQIASVRKQLEIFQNKESEFENVKLQCKFLVANQQQKLSLQASSFAEKQMQQQRTRHLLKQRKIKLGSQISMLVKRRQEAAVLEQKWSLSKRVPRQSKSHLQNFQFKNILRIFKILVRLSQKLDQGIIIQKQNLDRISLECQVDQNQKLNYSVRDQKKDIQFILNQQAAQTVVQMFKNITFEFNKKQQQFQQGQLTLKQLQINIQKLQQTKKFMKEKKERLSLTAFNQFSHKIELIEAKLIANCNKINQLTSHLCYILKKHDAYLSTIQKSLQQSEKGRKIWSPTINSNIIMKYEELLNRNPESAFAKYQNSQIYLNCIIQNRLLKMYSIQDDIDHSLDFLQNYQKLNIVSFIKAGNFIRQICQQIKILFQSFPIPLNCNIDKESNNICIQSEGYYCHDNYKLLERLEKEQLKKKGLLMKIPINLVPDIEIDWEKDKKAYYSTFSMTPRPCEISKPSFKYTLQTTKREKQAFSHRKIRMLVGKLQSIKRNPILTQSQSQIFNIKNPSLQNIRGIIRQKQPRQTIGVLPKHKMRTETRF